VNVVEKKLRKTIDVPYEHFLQVKEPVKTTLTRELGEVKGLLPNVIKS
jgi:hypothetical protein